MKENLNLGAGDALKKYRIPITQLILGKKLGDGGQGTVYEGDLHGQRVAVKEFFGTETPDAELIASLSHRNIIRFIGYCQQPPCIITEFCPHSLYERIRSLELIDFRTFFNWTTQIAHGMEYLHSINVTHRDLKSENILLAFDGALKICDFDFSKKTPTNLALIYTPLGTPRWTAPEIFRCEPYTRKVDVFSFGVVVWEIMMQKVPYDDVRNARRLLELNQIRIKFPADLPEQWKSFCIRFLASDANHRPEFFEIVEKLPRQEKIPEIDWQRLKKRWMIAAGDYWFAAKDGNHERDAKVDVARAEVDVDNDRTIVPDKHQRNNIAAEKFPPVQPKIEKNHPGWENINNVDAEAVLRDQIKLLQRMKNEKGANVDELEAMIRQKEKQLRHIIERERKLREQLEPARDKNMPA